MVEADCTLDTLGLFCPLPVILTSKKIKEMAEAQTLKVLSDDEGIKQDMPIWCRETGHSLIGLSQSGSVITLYIRKKGGAAVSS